MDIAVRSDSSVVAESPGSALQALCRSPSAGSGPRARQRCGRGAAGRRRSPPRGRAPGRRGGRRGHAVAAQQVAAAPAGHRVLAAAARPERDRVAVDRARFAARARRWRPSLACAARGRRPRSRGRCARRSPRPVEGLAVVEGCAAGGAKRIGGPSELSRPARRRGSRMPSGSGRPALPPSRSAVGSRSLSRTAATISARLLSARSLSTSCGSATASSLSRMIGPLAASAIARLSAVAEAEVAAESDPVTPGKRSAQHRRASIAIAVVGYDHVDGRGLPCSEARQRSSGSPPFSVGM